MLTKDFLQTIHAVPEDVLDQYLQHGSAFEAPRKTILTAPGETERYMYLVEKGIQKSYYLVGSKEHVIAFTYPPSFSGIPESFFTQSPSKYYLETITASSFLRISYRKHLELLKEYREIETLFRKGTEMLLKGVLERHYELMALDIETRFKNFARRSPHLLNRIPHKDLASYLRIDATNFSKLLNRIPIE